MAKSRKLNNRKLKNLYERVYRAGKEKFFTFSTDYVTKEVLAHVNFKGKRVLEIGCGTGETASAIAQTGGRVVAIDYAKEAIETAKNKYHHPNLEFWATEYQTVRGQFDIIVLQEVVEHLDNPLNHLRALKKKLRRRGKLVITCPSFMNVRGYVWMTLVLLFGVPMSLSDVNFLCPFNFEEFAKKLKMGLTWHTFNFDLGNNQQMMYDLRDRGRLKNALKDARLPGNATALLDWLEKVSRYDQTLPTSGAKGFYVLTRKD